MSDLFDRARKAAKLEDYAGKLVKLRGSANEQRGTCPLCQASPSSGSVFKVDVGRQTWRCFACDRFGDVVDLHAALTDKTGAEAARDLAGPAPATVQPRQAVERPIAGGDREARILRMAADMIGGSRPIVGTLGADYLLGRGIEPAIVDQLDSPRFHPDVPHSWNAEARVWRRAPAIICKIVTPGGATGGVHATYLADHGGGVVRKAELSPAKLMWGPQAETTAAGKRRGGAWLIGSFPDDGDLIVGEGIETSLSLASHLWRKGRREFGVAAALSLGALQGGLQRDRDDCVDLQQPKGDPASPAFIWPPCYTAGQKPPRALIAIDRDMSPITLKARNVRGRVLPFLLDAEARAALCARLACAAWSAAGWRALAMYPAANGDWNDTLKRSRA